MLHKNADTLELDLNKITVKEVLIQGQRYHEIRQGKALLFQGKRSKLPAAQLAIAEKIIAAQAHEIDMLNEKVIVLDERDIMICERLDAIEANLKSVPPTTAAAPKPKTTRRRKTTPKKEETNDLDTSPIES